MRVVGSAIQRNFDKKEGQHMAKVVMTLLVPREKKRKTKYPYAVQMSWTETYPLTGKEMPKVSVRLVVGSGDRKGQLESRQESVKNYRPEEWRAATLDEQAWCSGLLIGNPLPWYPGEEFAEKPNVFTGKQGTG